METVAYKDMNRTVTFILTMLLTVNITSVCADSEDWDLVNETSITKTYIDYNRIWKHDGYVYYWVLQNQKEPTETLGSVAVLIKGHCQMRSTKELQVSYYEFRWAQYDSNDFTDNMGDLSYARPGSEEEKILNMVCKHIN